MEKKKLKEHNFVYTLFFVIIILLLLAEILIVCFCKERNLWKDLVSVILSIVTIFVSLYVCKQTLDNNRKSQEIEFRYNKITAVQQELVKRFERFSPSDLYLFAFADFPSNEEATQEIRKLLMMHNKCLDLLTSAKLLYDNQEMVKSQAFLKSYADMIDSSLGVILMHINLYKNRDPQNWNNNMNLCIIGIQSIKSKYNDSINKANEYINALRDDLKDCQSINIDQILEKNSKELEEKLSTRISRKLSKETEL